MPISGYHAQNNSFFFVSSYSSVLNAAWEILFFHSIVVLNCGSPSIVCGVEGVRGKNMLGLHSLICQTRAAKLSPIRHAAWTWTSFIGYGTKTSQHTWLVEQGNQILLVTKTGDALRDPWWLVLQPVLQLFSFKDMFPAMLHSPPSGAQGQQINSPLSKLGKPRATLTKGYNS